MAWDQLAGFCSMQTRDCCLNQDFNWFLGPSKINSEPDFSPKLSQKKRLVPRVTTGPQLSSATWRLHCMNRIAGERFSSAILWSALGVPWGSSIFPSYFLFQATRLSRHTAPRQRWWPVPKSARVRGNPLLRAHTSWVYLGLSTVMRALILFDFKLYHQIGVMSSVWFFLPESLSQNNWH